VAIRLSSLVAIHRRAAIRLSSLVAMRLSHLLADIRLSHLLVDIRPSHRAARGPAHQAHQPRRAQ
jgi:hypothetical protein